MISHFITELVKEYQTSRRECQHSELPVLQVCLTASFTISEVLTVIPAPGNHPSLGPGHLDPAAAAQYAMVAGAGNGYDVYKGKTSLQTQSAISQSHWQWQHMSLPHSGINGVSILSS